MATNSFYVPASQTGSYVEQKRDASGTKLYAGQESEIGIQKQAALQNLSEQYNQTIQNAYESYLANEGKIRLSQMGQGYKEAYEQKANEAFMQNIAEANQTAANARAQIETSAAEQQTALQERYQQEVANLDRAAASMEDYLTYVKSLRGKTEEGQIDDTLRYFDEEQEKLSAADLYDKLLDAQPQSLYDEEGLAGQSYTDWLKSKYTKGTKEDSAWLQYMYGGGLSDFKRAAYQSSIDRREQAERTKQTVEQNRQASIPNYYGYIDLDDTDNVKADYNMYDELTNIELDGTKYAAMTNNDKNIYDAVLQDFYSRNPENALSGIRNDDVLFNIVDRISKRLKQYDTKQKKVGDILEINGIKFINTKDGIKVLTKIS